MKRETIIKGLKELVKKGWTINEEDGTIKNPETGRTIKIKTALSYEPSHPAYKLAKKQVGDTGEEEKEYDSSGETDYFEYWEDLPDNITKLYDKYFSEEPTFDYPELADIRDEFEKEGWTFDFGLDGDPIDLRPLRDDEKTSNEEPKTTSSEKPKKERPEEAPKRPQDMYDDEHTLEDFREFGNLYSDDMTPEQKDEYDNLTAELESANADLIGAQEDGNDQDFEEAAAEYNEIESKLYDLIDSIYEPENDSSMEYDEFDNSITFGDGEKVKVDYDGDFQYKGEWFNVNDYENEDELKQAISDKVGSKNENTSMKISKSRLREIVKEVIKEESEYQEFFKRALEKTGKSIPQMSDEEKKAFFDKIDAAWKGKGEKNEGNAFGAAVTKAKEQGKDSFEVGGKTYKVESVVNEQSLKRGTKLQYDKNSFVVDYIVDKIVKDSSGNTHYILKVLKSNFPNKIKVGSTEKFEYDKLVGLIRNKVMNFIKNESVVSEAKEVEVSSRAGRIANDVFNDSYRKVGKQTSTLTFKFNKSEDYKNFVDDLKGAGVNPKDILESVVSEGKKRFYQQDRVGSAKYTISYHDGKEKNKDGSDFYGIKTFRNKQDLEKFRAELLKKGYREDSGYKNESVVSEGASSEEKRVVLRAIKALAKYRNGDLSAGLQSVQMAADELESDIRKGRIK